MTRPHPPSAPEGELETEEVERESTPLGELVLQRYHHPASGESGHAILLDGAFLMASHGSHAERLMARLAHDELAPAPGAVVAVLVGGLGAGHTLRAVLDLPGVARVVVAEIGSRVADWNRRYFAAANGRAVDDPRVELVVGDVLALLSNHPSEFELVLLDVDNGPGWLAAAGNERLYQDDGLTTARRALVAGGVLAIWSPARNAALEARLSGLSAPWRAVDTAAAARREGEPPAVVYLVRR